ncbi:MAG: GDP-L-fucose synthase [Bacteroidota bacterium]
MDKFSKIYIAGHKGLVGSAILKNLKEKGYNNFVLASHKELDLTDQKATAAFFEREKPEFVFLAAAKVGGIVANNTYRAEFIYKNLMIQNNVIHQAWQSGVKKLLFLGSTCIYPKEAKQPISETELLTAPLEYTNEPYAIAKIAGIKMCESYNLQYGTNFLSVMPTNLYGPNDNFDLEKSHVLPALLRKILLGKYLEDNNWEALRIDLDKLPIESVNGTGTREDILSILKKYGIVISMKNEEKSVTDSSPGEPGFGMTRDNVSVEIWGSGKPLREFLWSEDMADACVFIMEKVDFKDVSSPLTKSLSRTSVRRDEGGLNRKQEIRNTHINIGTGEEISIKDLAFKIKEVVGFKGELVFNADKPDGTMRKVTDVRKLDELGWKSAVGLGVGIKRILEWYT